MHHTDDSLLEHEAPAIHEPRLWGDKGWTARVIKNGDGDGWAVEMIQDGSAEPALVGPWTMGRNKVDPKPLDATAHQTLVKTAAELSGGMSRNCRLNSTVQSRDRFRNRDRQARRHAR